MKKFKLNNTILIFLAMILGMVAGYFFKDFMINTKFIGDIFLRLIQMSVAVLIMGSVIESIGSLKIKELKRIGRKTFICFATTTILAALVGVFLANIIKPGVGINFASDLSTNIVGSKDTIGTIITNFFPNNIIASLSTGNTIQVIIFALLFGVAISIITEKTNDTKILELIKSFNQVLVKVIEIVMKAAPIGIFSLLGWAIGTYGFTVIFPLFKFLLTLALGAFLLLALFITVVSSYAKVNPLKLVSKLSRMGIVAFTTTSSAITLPVKMKDSEEKLGVSKGISNLVNPLGMSLNSDGLALFLAIACITIAQFFGINMTIQQQFVVVIMATLATLGTVVVPGGGLVALAIVLPTVGLPIEGVALLAGIDWFSGMFRTLLNVIDDALVAFVISVNENEFDRNIFDNSNIEISSEDFLNNQVTSV